MSVAPFRYDPPAQMPGQGGLTGDTPAVTALKIGYARVSTDGQDLTGQRQALAGLGVQPDRVYVIMPTFALCRPWAGIRWQAG